MSISRTKSPDWGVGEKLTSAQANALDANVTNALDKRSGQTDTLASVVSCSGAGRIIVTSVLGADADTTYQADGGNTDIRVTSAVTANRNYTLSATNAVDGDRVGIYCESSFNFVITVKDQAAATMFTVGNGADGTWAEFIYKASGWRLHRSAPLADVNPGLNGFRLCGSTGAPVADVSLTTTVYLTPYLSTKIAIYDTTQSRWRQRTTSEVSLALGTLANNTNYDVFAYWTGSAVALELSAAWTNDTTRSAAVALQDGVLVKSSDHSRRLVGTIRTVSTTQTCDSLTQRYIWNASNRVRRKAAVVYSSVASWTYVNPASTWRQANSQPSNKVEYVCGDSPSTSGCDLDMWVHCYGSASGNSIMSVGIAHSVSPSACTSQPVTYFVQGAVTPGTGGGGNNSGWPLSAHLVDQTKLGYNTLTWVETGSSNSLTYTFYGGAWSNNESSAAMHGWILV